MLLVFRTTILAILLLSKPLLASASSYFVEPMICKGQWNKRPPHYHPSFQWAGMKVISFYSVRAKDCALVDSSSTEAIYGSTQNEIVFTNSLDLGGWFGVALKKTDHQVQLPFGVWPDEMTLTIVKSEQLNGSQIDTLQGRYSLFDDYYYDLSCTAKVVQKPRHIENNTKNCK